MTKTLIKAAVAAMLVGTVASPALAANPETFTSTANIVKPLTLTKVTDLDFGTIVMGPSLTTATVSVSQDGSAVTCGDGSGSDLTCSVAATPASFDVLGVASQDVDLTYSSLTALTSGTNSIGFTLDAPATASLDTAGAASFGIGGTVTILNTTVEGVYTGDIDVTAVYQ